MIESFLYHNRDLMNACLISAFLFAFAFIIIAFSGEMAGSSFMPEGVCTTGAKVFTTLTVDTQC